MQEKIFSIGDVHGCRGHLERLLDIIPWQPSVDRLVFMGDYIDRGPESREVVEIVSDLARKHPRVTCLKGNHEQMLMNYLEGNDPLMYIMNGGRATLASYGASPIGGPALRLPAGHLEFLRSLSVTLETDEFLFVHAGIKPGISIAEQNPEDLLWIRDEFFLSEMRFEKTVVFGHTPFDEPMVLADRIGIDTGAVYGRKLTCLELPSRTFYQV